LFLRQFNCASVGKQINFDSIKMHGMFVKIKRKQILIPSDRKILITLWI